MRKSLVISSLLLLAPLAFGAERGHTATNGSTHSNAPAAAHSAASDRDKGTARAADVGKGKKKGLKRLFSRHNHQKN